jgi:hypothetical protein
MAPALVSFYEVISKEDPAEDKGLNVMVWLLILQGIQVLLIYFVIFKKTPKTKKV